MQIRTFADVTAPDTSLAAGSRCLQTVATSPPTRRHRFGSVALTLVVALLGAGQAVTDEVPAPAPEAASTAPAGPEVVVTTSYGSFTIRLLPELAPKHVAHFLKLAKSKALDKTTFHRVIRGGIIQGGDPLSKDPAKSSRYGQGGLGLLKAEFSERPMTRGAVAAVLLPGRRDSGGNQFFVCVNDQLALTGQYTIFGEVVEGMDVVGQISLAPVEGDRATDRIEMTVTVLEPASSSGTESSS